MQKKAVAIYVAVILMAILFSSCKPNTITVETSLTSQTEIVETAVPTEQTVVTEITNTPTLTPTPSPTPTPISTEELYSILDSIPVTDEPVVQSFGGYSPSDEALAQLYAAMEFFDNNYYHYSFTLIDINTGRGITYNPDEIFYPASSIKGPFALSFAELNPEAASNYINTINSMLVYSDNDAYALLNDTFGRQYIQQWFSDCNIVTSYANYKYPRLGSRDIAKLWIHGYDFLMNNEMGDVAREWLNHPNESVIYSVLGEMYDTYSKGGWFRGEDPSYNSTVDAGIVMSDYGPYVVVIQTNIPDNMNALSDLMLALEQIHQEISLQ